MKGLKKVFEGFSLKKFLITILCTTIISGFIGFTALFVNAFPTYMISEVFSCAEMDSDFAIQASKYQQEIFDTVLKNEFDNERTKFGDDYPTEGYLLFAVLNRLTSEPIFTLYILAISIGIMLGTIIYIIFVQKAKGVQMLLELAICGIAILLLLILMDLGYNAYINYQIQQVDILNAEYGGMIFDVRLNIENYIGLYIGVFLAAFIVNYIYQKLLANKLNKILHRQ